MPRFLIATLLAALWIRPGVAAERSWLKSHSSIVPSGAYTLISTSDGRWPRLERMLYQDDQGARLVLRFKIEQDGSSKTTIASVDEASSISLGIKGARVTLGYASGFVTFQDGAAPAPLDRQKAMAILAAYPSAFQGAVQRLALPPAGCSAEFDAIATVLRALVFGEAKCPEAVATTATATEVVKDFDPDTTPPGPFERPFGRAWFH